jgi:antirestriction protein ArdC
MTGTSKTNALEQLAEGIAQLTSSDRWQDWLLMQSRFHHYSFNNTLLIMLQRPDATRVAGFNAWRKLDRFVRKGEKGIWILAPMVYKASTDNKPETDDATKVIRGFKPVPVFDLSQTDGQELPEICIRLMGDQPGDIYDHLRCVAHGLGFTVEEDFLDGGTYGECSHTEKRIRLEARNDERQQVKTLAHELGHAILHEPSEGRPNSRPLLELEAESVAYVVCQNLGIETSDYSFGYVATWAGGNDEAQKAIRASGTRIQRAAGAILTALSGEDQAQEVA